VSSQPFAPSRRSANDLRLLSRIQRHVQIEHTTTHIAGLEYPWTKVVDPDSLLLHALSKSQEGTVELDPFWAATWRAASGLDQFLGTLPSLAGTRILELGGGSGRAGIAAGIRGADVLITDAVPTALLVCRFNARHVAHRVQITWLDWREQKSRLGQFPIIIGSDIVYDPKLFPILEPCLRRHLAPGGIVYLSEPQRHTGDRFESWIRAAGWNCTSTLIDLNDQQRDVRIFCCQPLTGSPPTLAKSNAGNDPATKSHRL
jgi:predicted nicotinamide N-methyase